MTNHIPRWTAAAALIVLIAVGTLSLLSLRPPAPVAATAPDTAFSADRAWRHLETIAARPHPHGSPAADSVRAYIVAWLDSLGLDTRVEASTLTAGRNILFLHNVVAVLPGTDPTGAVAVVTHYDSHRRAPGAGDDGLALSAVLETVRALRARAPLRNDVIFLVTDAEERGLVGARAFVASDPAFADIRVVLNFEGRGSGGPALMFQTGTGNAELLRIFHDHDPYPIGSSLFPEAYRFLPNDTDFTVFLGAGLRGLNFAHIDRAQNYHRETDTPANASAATLQHHGEHALAMTLAFGALDLRALPGADAGDAIFFNVPGIGLVRYPAAFALPHAALVWLLLIAVAVVAQRRGAFRMTGMFAGFALGLLALVVCIAAGVLAGRIAGMESEAGSFAAKLVLNEVPYMLAVLAVALIAVLAPLAWLAPRFGTAGPVTGMLLLPAALGTAAAVVAPGASYLLLWPVVFAVAALYVATRATTLTLQHAVVITALLVPAAALWAPHLSLFLTGLTLRMAPGLGVVVALAAMSIAPAAPLLRR